MALPATEIPAGWLQDVRELASEHTFISLSMIQRRVHIPRAAGEALLRALQEEGLTGPRIGDGSREVLKHG